MSKTILTVLVSNRKEVVPKVQKILSAWGCIIKTRLGIHDGVKENCSNEGLLILELAGSDTDNKELERKLKLIDGVVCKLIKLSLKKN